MQGERTPLQHIDRLIARIQKCQNVGQRGIGILLDRVAKSRPKPLCLPHLFQGLTGKAQPLPGRGNTLRCVINVATASACGFDAGRSSSNSVGTAVSNRGRPLRSPVQKPGAEEHPMRIPVPRQPTAGPR